MKKVIFTLIGTLFTIVSLATNYYSIASGVWSNSRGGASCACTPPAVIPIGDTVFIDQMSCNDQNQPPSTAGFHFDDVTGCHSLSISSLSGAIVIEPGGYLLNNSGITIESTGSISVEAGGYFDNEGSTTIRSGGTVVVDGGLDWLGSLTVDVGGSMTGSGGVRCFGAHSCAGTVNISGAGCASCPSMGVAPPIGPSPVELLNFSGQLRSTYEVQLNWITLVEENNDYFYVSKFTKGTDPIIIGYIDGHGNSNNPISYNFTDYSEITDLTYYELTQVDFDGQKTVLKTVAISNAGLGTLRVQPNPTSNTLNYQLDIDSEIVTSEIYDQHGKRMFVSFESDFKNSIYVGQYPEGLYYLKITTSSAVFQSKFIVAH